MKNIEKILKGIGIGVLSFIVVILVFGGYWLILHNRTLTLPMPTGSHPVGRIEYDWIDADRIDLLSDQEDEKRELLIWIWYPASESTQTSTMPYLPAAWVKAHNDAQGIARFYETDFSAIRTHSFETAPVAQSESAFPVVIMQPGFGLVPVDYTVLAENLASHGYIVVGIHPTYSSNLIVFPDGRLVWQSAKSSFPAGADEAGIDAFASRLGEAWTDDAIFVMDMHQSMNVDRSNFFYEKLDLAHMGLFGHSLGGATAISVCKKETRCVAGADLDGGLFSYHAEGALQVPFLFMENDFCETNCDPSKYQAFSTSNSTAYFLSIEGTGHYNFSDFSLRRLALARPKYHKEGYIGSISTERGLEITNAYLVAFFDRYLKNIESDLLQGSSSAFPEVRFEKR